LPRINSPPLSGVDTNCSMVPLSHSRAMESDVRMAAMIIITTAIRPGKI